MSDLIGEYLAHLRRTRAAQTTIDLRRSVLGRVARELALGIDYPNDGLDHAASDELAEWLANPKWQPKTQAAYDDSLRSYYRWAVKTGHLDWDPMDDVERIKAGRRLPRPVPRDQLAAILSTAVAPYRLWYVLGVYGGLRCCEVARLHTEHITEQEIRLLGKGDKERVVPTYPTIWAAVKDLPEGPVTGRAMSARDVSRKARKHLDRIGHPDVTMHRLRHSFATMTLEETGGDIVTLSELMGHASVSTTQIYTLVTSARRQAAVLSLPDLAAD